MVSYDYAAPQHHISTREVISADLLQGAFPANRATWDDFPRFAGWPAHLQRSHAAISEAGSRLTVGLEALLDEPEGSIPELIGMKGMNRLGASLIAQLNTHQSFEDRGVLPGFLKRFPHLATVIDLLEKDHAYVEIALNRAETAFANLRPQGTSKMAVDQALEQAQLLMQILRRHAYDEEDILIPPVLHAYA
jgi:hypothetical protein